MSYILKMEYLSPYQANHDMNMAVNRFIIGSSNALSAPNHYQAISGPFY